VKYISLLSFLFLGLVFGASTSSEIRKSEKNLSETSTAKQETNRRLGKIAHDIKSAKKDVAEIDVKIDVLSQSQKTTQDKYDIFKVELSGHDEDLNTSMEDLLKKKEKFITLLSQKFSITFAMNQGHEPTERAVILYEVYATYKKQNAEALSSLATEIASLKLSQSSKVEERAKIAKEIMFLVKEQQSLAKEKENKVEILEKLSTYEEKYNAKLEKIVDRQYSLRETLSTLNILREKEVKVSQKIAYAKKEAIRKAKEEERRLRRAKAKTRKAKEAYRLAKTVASRKRAKKARAKAHKEEERISNSMGKVKHINSSYKKSKTYTYRGSKTISPLANARLIKKFGTYIDPIYQIKIFNESITLKAKYANAKVKNVLNGKVVFAGKSSMLGKVVVVSHNRRIHTVYAGLSKIAPTIYNGAKIKKGYVVGKVSTKLIFQATKNSKHINPLELIAL
jgi:murein DD-endopeptidase MepM/ murein hydrolase activator NlpD